MLRRDDDAAAVGEVPDGEQLKVLQVHSAQEATARRAYVYAPVALMELNHHEAALHGRHAL
jgi:hypothetical protein